MFINDCNPDAYPQDHAKKERKKKQQNATSNERLGVLVFHIHGMPANKIDRQNSVKVGISCDSEGKSEPISDSDGNARSRSPSKPTLRRHDDDKSNKSQRNLEDLMDRLQIDSDKIEQGHNEWLKKFPDTAAEFFDQLRSWFSTLLARKQAQLANKEEVNGMYR
uniref:Uncharacterized protein n=1 Tax=Aplanochytrium stocchinoi TaxID=215587 RepID=A0A7S3V1H9_9STRA|mmetsp:Transcript_3721/g.4377  ORF Transcript_3721/g.4377 Transcript_3721/m.4377 type:complete len:164 (+) Transcript_3721:823-1314(+)